MKKNKILWLGMVVLSIFLVSGCGKENITLDLQKAKNNIDQLMSEDYSRATAVTYMVDTGLFGENLEDVYNLNELGINQDYIMNVNGSEDYSMAITKEDPAGYSYFVGKPKAENKEDLIKQLDEYYKDVEGLFTEELNGYLVYLVSENNDIAFDFLKENGHQPLFPMLMELDEESLEPILGIQKEDVEEFAIQLPMTIVSSQSYFIIKPKEGKKDTIKNAMNEYLENQEQQWSTYLAEQYELVKNRKETELGDYLIYIISKDNDKVLNAIKEAQIK